jgi:hypothetical protein
MSRPFGWFVLSLCLLAPLVAEAQRWAVTLPEGPGRDRVQATCGMCHQLNMVTGAAGYDEKGWRALISTMVLLP